MNNDERFMRQLEFILEIDKEKNILRQTHLCDATRQENDAEHAWHMAIMVYLLREYANEGFDLARAMMMALIHDVVEIDAGDTYAYDDEAKQSQAEREALAAERIYGILPPDQCEELKGLFREFELGESPEARFARAMDNFQPLLLNNKNGGGDWRSHGVCAEKIFERQKRSALGSSKIFEYSRSVIDKNIECGNIKK